jgi:undecaprenyl diphosphate synthase
MAQMTLNNKVNHLAFIMDGNRRWAKSKKLPVIAGHKEGVEALKKVTKYCLNNDIKDLTVYAFSTENWNRNSSELDFLFKLLAEVALRELDDLRRLGVKVDFLGDISKFENFNIKDNLTKLEKETSFNENLNLHIALNYGSISELTFALNKLSKTVNDYSLISEEDITNSLYLSSMPDPDLLIRTGGEKRLSNFLLWQSANSELVFTDTLWPDFSAEELENIILNYQNSNLLEGVGA